MDKHEASSSGVEEAAPGSNGGKGVAPFTKATTATRTSPRKQFHKFPELPLEIRRIIWRLSLPRGRIIEVMWSADTREFYSNAISPVALQVCNESREEALRIYDSVQLAMGLPLVNPVKSYASHLGLDNNYSALNTFNAFIDWAQDTLYLASWCLPPLAATHFLSCLKQHTTAPSTLRLALSLDTFCSAKRKGRSSRMMVVASMLGMKNLEKPAVYVDSDKNSGRWKVAKIEEVSDAAQINGPGLLSVVPSGAPTFKDVISFDLRITLHLMKLLDQKLDLKVPGIAQTVPELTFGYAKR